jgi:hypothetical protein
MVRDSGRISVFNMWISTFPSTVFEKIVFSPMDVFGTFVKNLMAVTV